MIFSVSLIAILAPIILVQYGLSLFCLLKLVFLDQPIKKFVLWNLFILLVVGIGVATFLVCYFKFRDKVFPKKAAENQESLAKEESVQLSSEEHAQKNEQENEEK